jgi:undecaprenyl-diphosphatase
VTATWLGRRLSPTEPRGLRFTLVVLAGLLVAGPFLFLLLQVTGHGSLTVSDSRFATSLHRVALRNDLLVSVSRVVTFFGGAGWLFPLIAVAAAFFWIRGRAWVSLYLVVTNLGGAAVDNIVKALVARPRPDLVHPLAHARGMSFPSGHAMAAAIAYGSLLVAVWPLVSRGWRVVLVIAYSIVVALIATSRLTLGVHFLSDVLGGVVLGLAWLALMSAAFVVATMRRSSAGASPG